MQIKDVMTKEVNLVSPTATVVEASGKMKEDDIGILPVAEHDRLVGVVTDRDIVVRILAEGKDATATKVTEAMSDKVLYCFEDQSPEEVAANMGENQVRRLPVIDRDKRLVGIVSLGDLSVSDATQNAGEALEQISQPAH